MLGKRERRQPELFVAGSLRDLVPDEHVLVRVDRVLDLGWLPDEVADCYCAHNGRPPIRWFIGYGLHERLPDHSSLTRIRQRWGAARFQRIFQRTVEACVAAGIAKGEVVHIDSTLVRADVSWDAIARRHAEAVLAANSDEASGDGSSDQGFAGQATATRPSVSWRARRRSDRAHLQHLRAAHEGVEGLHDRPKSGRPT
jgi:IS5 family transposase